MKLQIFTASSALLFVSLLTIASWQFAHSRPATVSAAVFGRDPFSMIASIP